MMNDNSINDKAMKAIVCTKYGSPDVLVLQERKKPVPKANEILVKIKATSINSGECRIRRADPFLVRLMFGFRKPKHDVLGITLAGEVEQIGSQVTKFKVGDQIFGLAGMTFGTYAEYICLSETASIAIKPATMTFGEAASIVFGGHTALCFLRKANIHIGQKVLIYGASGSVGTSAVQIAKYFGAEVTAVCSTSNIDLMKSIGADKTIDYTKIDLANIREKFHVVIETVGKLPSSLCFHLLDKDGTLILGSAMAKDGLKGMLHSFVSSQKVIIGMAKASANDIQFLKELVERNKLIAVIDKTFVMKEIVEAHRYVDGGHKKGNVVLMIDTND